jgi:hypothetical protein
MKHFKMLLVLALVAVTAAPPQFAFASQADVASDTTSSPKFPLGRSNGFTQVGSAGWEDLGTGTLTAQGTMLAPALRPGYSAVRVSTFCTFTGAVSGRIILILTDKDPAGNDIQLGNVATAVDNVSDTGGVLTGAATAPVLLEVGKGFTDASAAGTTRTYFRRGHIPPPIFGASMMVLGTFTTLSCQWYVHGWRG